MLPLSGVAVRGVAGLFVLCQIMYRQGRGVYIHARCYLERASSRRGSWPLAAQRST